MLPRTPAQALADAQRIAAGGVFLTSRHAEQRMKQRGVTRQDIRVAISRAHLCIHQPDDGDGWRLEGGFDRAGDPLTVLSFESGMLVVTVF